MVIYSEFNEALQRINQFVLECLEERRALKAEADSLRNVQLRQPAICPWFIHGEKCANQNTLLKCYEKPCLFDRGKQQAGG
jgi:hypothetical protein